MNSTGYYSFYNIGAVFLFVRNFNRNQSGIALTKSMKARNGAGTSGVPRIMHVRSLKRFATTASKNAIDVLSRYVAAEYGLRGMRASAVAPGGIVTDFNNAAIRSNQFAQQAIVTKTPLGRLGAADDIAGLVSLPCNDDAHWLTGQRLAVTGGFNLSPERQRDPQTGAVSGFIQRNGNSDVPYMRLTGAEAARTKN